MEAAIEVIGGVYRIHCLAADKSYIGSGINVYSRIGDHVSSLTANKHPNKALQVDWNTYGKDAFVFHLLQEINEPKERLRVEKSLIRELDRDKVYNIVWRKKAIKAKRPYVRGGVKTLNRKGGNKLTVYLPDDLIEYIQKARKHGFKPSAIMQRGVQWMKDNEPLP